MVLLRQGRAFAYTKPFANVLLASCLGVHRWEFFRHKPTATLISLKPHRAERRPCAHVVIRVLPLRNEAVQWRAARSSLHRLFKYPLAGGPCCLKGLRRSRGHQGVTRAAERRGEGAVLRAQGCPSQVRVSPARCPSCPATGRTAPKPRPTLSLSLAIRGRTRPPGGKLLGTSGVSGAGRPP